MNRVVSYAFIAIVSIPLFHSSVMASDVVGAPAFWPQWRGPNRDDVATDTGLLTIWPAQGPPLLWTGTGLGAGYSSLAIANGRIYTVGDRADGEYLICLADADGKELWSTRIGDIWKDGGPRSTPTIDGDAVYALTPQGNLVCVAATDGAARWHKQLSQDFGGKMMSGWGYSESPLIDGDRIVCTPGADDAALVSLDKKTGEPQWKAKVENCGGSGYASIVKCSPGGIEQYVTLFGKSGGVVGVRASDGKLLWRHNGVAGNVANIPTPVVRGDYVFYSTGYDDGGSALIKIVPRGEGLMAEEVYKKSANDLRNHHGGFVLVGDYLYGGHGQNQGMPFCLNFETGESRWRHQRGPGEGSAAVLYADGHLYFSYENGVVALLEANPDEYKVVSTFSIPDVSKPSWAHPVITGGRLYLRDKERLFCYELRDKTAGQLQ